MNLLVKKLPLFYPKIRLLFFDNFKASLRLLSFLRRLPRLMILDFFRWILRSGTAIRQFSIQCAVKERESIL